MEKDKMTPEQREELNQQILEYLEEQDRLHPKDFLPIHGKWGQDSEF